MSCGVTGKPTLDMCRGPGDEGAAIQGFLAEGVAEWYRPHLFSRFLRPVLSCNINMAVVERDAMMKQRISYLSVVIHLVQYKIISIWIHINITI